MKVFAYTLAACIGLVLITALGGVGFIGFVAFVMAALLVDLYHLCTK